MHFEYISKVGGQLIGPPRPIQRWANCLLRNSRTSKMWRGTITLKPHLIACFQHIVKINLQWYYWEFVTRFCATNCKTNFVHKPLNVYFFTSMKHCHGRKFIRTLTSVTRSPSLVPSILDTLYIWATRSISLERRANAKRYRRLTVTAIAIVIDCPSFKLFRAKTCVNVASIFERHLDCLAGMTTAGIVDAERIDR